MESREYRYREKDVDVEPVMKWYDSLTEEEKAKIREQIEQDKERIAKMQEKKKIRKKA